MGVTSRGVEGNVVHAVSRVMGCGAGPETPPAQRRVAGAGASFGEPSGRSSPRSGRGLRRGPFTGELE